MTEHRGSRMHVLDWVDDSNFADEFLALAQPVACGRDQSWQHMPKSSDDDREARLESFGPRAFPEHASVFEELKSWWLAHGGNTPNWDIAARANIEGRPGLILVEAKANHPELDNGPKTSFRLSAVQAQRMTPEQAEASRARSQENEDSIAAALDEATRALAGEFEGIRLDHTSDYQLSNRIAFAWKVASLGMPVVLMYLGFTGDDAFGDRQFRNEADWKTAFTTHCGLIGSAIFLERRIETGGAPMWILVRARPSKRVSPPANPGPRVGHA